MKMVQVSKEFVCLENVVKMFLALLLETFVYPEQYLELVQTVNVLMVHSFKFLNVEFLHCLQNQQILVSKSHRLRDSLYYVPLKTISILDWKQTVVCNTTRDCQDFGVQAECSKVHGVGFLTRVNPKPETRVFCVIFKTTSKLDKHYGDFKSHEY